MRSSLLLSTPSKEKRRKSNVKNYTQVHPMASRDYHVAAVSWSCVRNQRIESFPHCPVLTCLGRNLLSRLTVTRSSQIKSFRFLAIPIYATLELKLRPWPTAISGIPRLSYHMQLHLTPAECEHWLQLLKLLYTENLNVYFSYCLFRINPTVYCNT